MNSVLGVVWDSQFPAGRAEVSRWQTQAQSSRSPRVDGAPESQLSCEQLSAGSSSIFSTHRRGLRALHPPDEVCVT